MSVITIYLAWLWRCLVVTSYVLAYIGTAASALALWTWATKSNASTYTHELVCNTKSAVALHLCLLFVAAAVALFGFAMHSLFKWLIG